MSHLQPSSTITRSTIYLQSGQPTALCAANTWLCRRLGRLSISREPSKGSTVLLVPGRYHSQQQWPSLYTCRAEKCCRVARLTDQLHDDQPLASFGRRHLSVASRRQHHLPLECIRAARRLSAHHVHMYLGLICQCLGSRCAAQAPRRAWPTQFACDSSPCPHPPPYVSA